MSTYGEVAKNNTLFTKGTQIAHSILDFFYLTFAAIGDEMFQKKKKKIENQLYWIRNGEF